MLRKVGFLFALMLTLPAIANAWTLAAKVSGSAGSVQVGAEPALTIGSKYYTVAGSTDVTITSANKIALVTVDGVKVTPAAGVVSITAPVAPKTTRSVVAYFSPVTFDVSVTQAAGGTLVAQAMNAAGTKGIGSISRTGIANLPSGTKVKLTALPNADFKVTGINATPFTGAAGVPQSVIVTVTAATPATVAFAAAPVVKANVALRTDDADAKLIPAIVDANTAVKFDASGSRPAGAVTYAWSGSCGTTGTAATAAITASANCTATVVVTSTANAALTDTASLAIVVNQPNADQSGVCVQCHTNRDAAIVAQFATSAYQIGGNTATCQDCHSIQAHLAKCADCHTADTRVRQSHAFAAAGPKVPKCIECHSIARKLDAMPGTPHAGDVSNSGVRSITNEFTKWSHHVTGVALQDAHCAACHLEGKAVAGEIVIDAATHMDGATTLRNADTDAPMAWDPASPDHTLMDNFCMSCHDGNGATSPLSTGIRAVMIPAQNKVASATNPFGDTISNRYDKMQRPAVVDAKGQFDLSNPSHHAVMGQKYSGRTRATGPRQIANPAAFTNNSGAVANGKTVGARSTIYDSRVKRTTTPDNSPAYDVSKFVESYETLSPAPNTTDKTLGDDSVLHCGDCHTVGQYRKADVGVLPKNAAVIGAHGSNNEYMLRNSIGTDERHVGQTYSANAAKVNNFTNLGSPLLVCFNCHSYQVYGSIGNATGATGTNHAGEYANGNRCNGPVNTISFIGYTTSVNDTHEPYVFRLGLGQRDGIMTGSTSTSDTDFSNLFGMQCANCHNAGPNNLFGGIHGSKVKTYADANGAAQNAYRFLPGLGNTMYVPGSAAGVGTVSDLNWEVKSIGTVYNTAKTAVVDNGGCYTIVPEEGPGADSRGLTADAPYSVTPAFEQTVDQPAAGTHIFGTWGGCDDHRGNAHGKAFATGTTIGQKWDTATSAAVNTGYIDPVGGTVPTGGAGVVRKVLRPVTY